MSRLGIRRPSGAGGLLVPPRLPEVFAIQRAIHRDLALGAATDGANVAAHARAETPRTAGLANCARHSLSIEVRMIR